MEEAVSGGQGVVVRSRRAAPARTRPLGLGSNSSPRQKQSVISKLRAEDIVAHGGLAEALLHLDISIRLLNGQRAREVERPEDVRKEELLEFGTGEACR